MRYGWLTLVLLFFWPSLVLETIPRFEGRTWPVVSALIDLRVTETIEGKVLVSGTVEKYRDCAIDHVEWRYATSGGRTIPVTASSTARRHNYDPGKIDVGPWIMTMTRDEFFANASAYAVHDCHTASFLPWLTHSTLFVPHADTDAPGVRP